MADWQRKIRMGDVWKSEDVPLIAKTAADRLEALSPFTDRPGIDHIKKLLVTSLRKVADSKNPTFEKFNSVWNRVYGWADISLDDKFAGKKVCWIDLWEKP